MDLTNPAYRLLSILEAGKKISHDRPCRSTWAALLKTNETSSELLVRIGKTMELPSLIIAELQDSHPEESDSWSHWSTQVQNAFMSQQLNSNWGSFISRIDDHSYRYLRVHGKLIQVNSKTKPLDNSVLTEARSKLNDCLTQLLESDIDKEVKSYLARNIRKIITAIDEYSITGTTGIFDSLEIIMGHQVFDKKYSDVLKKTDIGQSITSIVGTVANAMAIATGLPQLGQSVDFIAEQIKQLAQ